MITRANLGWPPVTSSRSITNKGLVIHYDGSNQGLRNKTCSACRTYWKNARKHHMAGNGWVDIGYAFFVCPHGEVYEGRGYNRVQAAAKQTPGKMAGGNTEWVNVTFGSGPSEEPTAVQTAALLQLRAKLMNDGMAGAVKGHQDFTATSCPGHILYAMVRTGHFNKGVDDMDSKDVWNHEIPVPWGTKENPDWQADSLLVEANKRIRDLETSIHNLQVKIDAILTRVS